jgi:hypothetical protein
MDSIQGLKKSRLRDELFFLTTPNYYIKPTAARVRHRLQITKTLDPMGRSKIYFL